jgi:hypothetical protein
MKNFYSKTFTQVSPIYFIIMIFIAFCGGKLRSQIAPPISEASTHANFLTKFGLSKLFILNNINSFFLIELIVSIALIVMAYFMCKFLIGKIAGLFSAIFVAFYPYFIINCYDTSVFFLLFFMLYLMFQGIALSTMLKKYNIFVGIFFTLAVIANPACIILGIIPYLYSFIKVKNIAVLYNFIFFLLGIFIVSLLFAIYTAINNISFLDSLLLADTFSPFKINLVSFSVNPLLYITSTILPFLSNNIAHPAKEFISQPYSYLHYILITLSAMGALYSLVEDKIRFIAILLLFILIQALFMPLNFGYIFMLIIVIATYMIDKVFNDVFGQY